MGKKKKLLLVGISIFFLSLICVFNLRADVRVDYPFYGNVGVTGQTSLQGSLIFPMGTTIASSETINIPTDGSFFWLTGGGVVRTFGCDTNYNTKGRVVILLPDTNTIFEDGHGLYNIDCGGCNYNEGAGRPSIWIFDGCFWRLFRTQNDW